MSHLVDTSVLTRLARPSVRDVVEPMAHAGQLARPGICDLEIGYAARNADEWDRLIGALDAFEAVETSAAHVARVLQVQRLLAARGQRGSLYDLLTTGQLASVHIGRSRRIPMGEIRRYVRDRLQRDTLHVR